MLERRAFLPAALCFLPLPRGKSPEPERGVEQRLAAIEAQLRELQQLPIDNYGDGEPATLGEWAKAHHAEAAKVRTK